MITLGVVISFIFGFIIGCYVMFILNAKGLANMIKRGEAYIKRNGKWEPRNPFRSSE